VIGGYTTQPKHPGALGALLMGYYNKDDFILAGKVGTGFSHSEGHALLTKLKDLEQSSRRSSRSPAPHVAMPCSQDPNSSPM
jgi:bifunctional non-homologous end joining protein LigD